MDSKRLKELWGASPLKTDRKVSAGIIETGQVPTVAIPEGSSLSTW